MQTFTDDKDCALRIVQGDPKPWEQLLDRITDNILSVAIAWCSPSCARGTCSLLRQHGPVRQRLGADDCDCVMACYLHISRKHIPAFVRCYEGDLSLSQWCIRCLRGLTSDTHRRIDFARTGHTCSRETHLRLHVPRIRTPSCLQEETADWRDLYRLLCQDRTSEEIAITLRLPLETVQERIDMLRAMLAERDWDAYMEMLHRQKLQTSSSVGSFETEAGEEAAEIEPPAAAPSVDQAWQLRQAILAIARWMQEQPEADRKLLRLYLYKGASAAEILAQLGDGPDGPRTTRQVYARIETLLNRMLSALPNLLAIVDEVHPERKTFVENLPFLFALIEEREGSGLPALGVVRTAETHARKRG